MYKFAFEKLEVWQLSRKFVVKVYQLTSRFPNEEKFGLVNQLRRAAVSISSNLAEGNSRLSGKDKAHFFQISFSSLMEVLNQFIISADLGYISDEELNQVRKDTSELSNKINALHKSVRK